MSSVEQDRRTYINEVAASLNEAASKELDPDSRWRLTSAATRLTDFTMGIRSGSYDLDPLLSLLPQSLDARVDHLEMARILRGRRGFETYVATHERTALGIEDKLIENGWGVVVDVIKKGEKDRAEVARKNGIGGRVTSFLRGGNK